MREHSQEHGLRLQHKPDRLKQSRGGGGGGGGGGGDVGEMPG